jgi:hypothetical protein
MSNQPTPAGKTQGGLGATAAAGRDWLVGGLALGLYLLAALWIWMPQENDNAPAPDVQPKDLAARLAEHQSRIADLIPVTAERPLFQADRRPVAAAEAPPPPADAVLMLVGILVDGEDRMALVRRSTSEELFPVEAGSRLGKWQIISVDISSITVSENDGTPFTLRLDG